METVTSGGRELSLYLGEPTSPGGSGVLLVHPWWGFNECIRDVCDRLAGEGFHVVAPDLYDGEVAETIREAEAMSSGLDATRATEDVSAAFEYLFDHPNLAAGCGVMGFSMGVYYALNVVQARPADVDAAVLFYGTSDGEYSETDTAMLGHYAENDPFESERYIESLRERLSAGNGSVTFYTYPDTEHWFLESDRPEYDEDAAGLAWSRTVEFLRTEL